MPETPPQTTAPVEIVVLSGRDYSDTYLSYCSRRDLLDHYVEGDELAASDELLDYLAGIGDVGYGTTYTREQIAAGLDRSEELEQAIARIRAERDRPRGLLDRLIGVPAKSASDAAVEAAARYQVLDQELALHRISEYLPHLASLTDLAALTGSGQYRVVATYEYRIT